MFKYKWTLIFLVLTLSSCAGISGYQSASSGKIGCPPQEIQVSNVRGSGYTFGSYTRDYYTWDAECKGIKYYCSEATKLGGESSCAQAK